MRTPFQRLAVGAIAAAVMLGIAGCGGMSTRNKDTAIGAGLGAAGGAILTDGSVMGTLGGAAVGGVVGNQVGKNK
ncbi:MAG TPA: glycine zipper 2TM domain-containing protein [Burkholderiales bacterium]|nr:glycine zipper 2TM domain-containing protein [Burkholderiales bacterium]